MSSRAGQEAEARERREQEERAASTGRRRRRLVSLGAVVALAAIVVAVAVALSQSGKSEPSRSATGGPAGAAGVAALFRGIPQSGTSVGNSKAPVTLTEFADLQCPFCRQFAQQSLATIVQRYVRPGRVRLEFRNLAFIGPDSVRAARLAAAVGRQNRLWQFVDLFYRNQGQENSGYATDAFLRRIAGGVRGLDVSRAMAARGTPFVTRQIAAAEAAAQRFRIDGTPSFLIARRGSPERVLKVSALTPDAFTGPLDAELRRR